MSLVTVAGRTTVSQCFHRGCSTSFSDSHRCDLISRRVAVTPGDGRSRTTFHAKLGSGWATYRSSAVGEVVARAGDCGDAVSTTGSGRSLEKHKDKATAERTALVTGCSRFMEVID